MRSTSRRFSVANLCRSACCLVFSILMLGFTQAVSLQAGTDGYKMPPQAIADMVDAPPTPYGILSPDRDWLLLVRYPTLVSLEEVSQPELRLAGLRINPRTNSSSRAWYYNELMLKRISDGAGVPLKGLPDNPRIDHVRWSPDGRWLAFAHTGADAVELWIAEVKTGQAKRLSDIPLNGAYGTLYSWPVSYTHLTLPTN